jgi:hypothetical protein
LRIIGRAGDKLRDILKKKNMYERTEEKPGRCGLEIGRCMRNRGMS